MIKILIIGDIVAKSGRYAVRKNIFNLKQKYQIDLTIANVENVTHGRGIAIRHYNELREMGIDVMTSGNHIFDIPDGLSLAKANKILLPINYCHLVPNCFFVTREIKNQQIVISNVMGNVFMRHTDNAFRLFQDFLKKEKAILGNALHIVDFHGEATAEKRAFAECFGNSLSLVFGTHTHVQTNDDHILSNGCGFISDIGMTGPYDSLIGAKKESIITGTLNSLPYRVDVTDSIGQLNGIIVEFSDQKKLTKLIKLNITPSKNEHTCQTFSH